MEINEITEKVIGCLFKVHNTLGCGFAEKVYVNASVLELRKLDLKVEVEYPITVRYDNVIVGQFFSDMLVAVQVLVEFKVVKLFEDVHTAQCLNHLRASGKSLFIGEFLPTQDGDKTPGSQSSLGEVILDFHNYS